MINLATALGLAAIEKHVGASQKTAEILIESEQINQQGRRMMNSIAVSTDEILEQISLRGRLIAESMKMDNLRRFKQIETERARLLF